MELTRLFKKNLRTQLKKAGASNVSFRVKGPKRYIYVKMKEGYGAPVIKEMVETTLKKYNMKIILTSGDAYRITARLYDLESDEAFDLSDVAKDVEQAYKKYKTSEVLPKLDGWQERLVNEHDDLYEKAVRLGQFIRTEECARLDLYAQALMSNQLGKMLAYGRCLAERLIHHGLEQHSRLVTA